MSESGFTKISLGNGSEGVDHMIGLPAAQTSRFIQQLLSYFSTSTGIEIFVIPWDQLLYPCVVEVCRLGSETVRESRLHLSVDLMKKRIFCGHLAKELRKRLVKCFVWSVALHGTETWTLRRSKEKRIETFEIWTWSGMERVKWTDRIKNEAVLKRVGEERMMLKLIRKRKRNWFDLTTNGGRAKSAVTGRLRAHLLPGACAVGSGERVTAAEQRDIRMIGEWTRAEISRSRTLQKLWFGYKGEDASLVSHSEFECSGPQLEDLSSKFSGSSLKVWGSRFCERE
ncbi:hypothetical protein ANN_10485 [Periplaneta americana]|uniref:Uncharacterized protein n=1 Tax=Periplaneta americana TaxID=6978 RepID=A0ABQ8TPH6_PERAM|nr:hypothetical protein ANN_10485 [Periplaneta americana]